MPASLAVRGCPAPGRRLAVRARGGRASPVRSSAHARRRRPAIRLGVGDEARDSGRDARCGGGRARRPRRAGRPARRDLAAPARSRVGTAVRGRALRSRGPAAGGSIRTTASRSLQRSSRSAPRCRSPSTSRTSGQGRPRELPTARPAQAWRGRSPTCWRSRASSQSPTRLAPETLAEAIERAVRRARRRAAGLRPAGSERLGARVRAARRQSAALDRRRATRPRPSGTSAAAARSSGSTPWRASRSRCLTDLAFGDWAAEAWPRLADAVLAAS